MWKSKYELSLLLGSSVLFACNAGNISEPGPVILDEAFDDGEDAELSSNDLTWRGRNVAGSDAAAALDRWQRVTQLWRNRGRGNAGAGGVGGSAGAAAGGKGGSASNTGGKGGAGGAATGGAGGKAGSGGAAAGAGGKAGSGGAAGAGGKAGSGGAAAGAVGVGDIDRPISGPAPTELANLGGGAPFKLVKNWDFGANGTIRNINELSAEFEYRDQFGTIANGTHYGAVIVAPSNATPISASGLNLPNNRQPVEDPARPYREWTQSTLKTYVRPLDPKQTTVSVNAHNAGCGSFMAKWSLPAGGDRLGHDIVWETRVRIPTPLPAYWFALWTSGNQWNGGAEMDLVEAFGASHIFANAFHSDSVGGTNSINYSSWPTALTRAGVPEGAARDLRQWHIWTWLYRDDNTYEAYYDGHRVQYGKIEWTNGGGENGTPIDMRFLFDFGWGHTDIADVNITLPASQFPMTYEIDYSRVYLR
jgi:hypothetical protein